MIALSLWKSLLLPTHGTYFFLLKVPFIRRLHPSAVKSLGMLDFFFAGADLEDEAFLRELTLDVFLRAII